MSKSLYMHTLNGKPAFFDPKEKLIFYAGNDQTSMFGGVSFNQPALFRNSLKQIRSDQKADEITCLKSGVLPNEKGERDYIRSRFWL